MTLSRLLTMYLWTATCGLYGLYVSEEEVVLVFSGKIWVRELAKSVMVFQLGMKIC